jgi:hypothetical protein
LAQKLGGVPLDENLGLKVQPSGISPVLMAIAGIAIEASVLTARIGVHRVGNWDVGAFYAVDDGGGENLYVGGLGLVG